MKLLYLVESGESKFLVFDEMPDKISTKYGDDTIIGRIGGIAGNRRLTSFESVQILFFISVMIKLK